MQQSRWIKVLTLSSFLLFIATFVLYRSGQLDAWFENKAPSVQTSHNGGSIADNTIDTTKPAVPDTIQRRILMSSSKSIVLSEPPKRLSYLDSAAKKRKMDSLRRRDLIMSSSKSGIIFKPEPLLKTDRLRMDTSKLLKRKQ